MILKEIWAGDGGVEAQADMEAKAIGEVSWPDAW
jgi:hypothetical protein